MKTSKYIWNATSHISPLKPWKPYEEREQEIHVEWSKGDQKDGREAAGSHKGTSTQKTKDTAWRGRHARGRVVPFSVDPQSGSLQWDGGKDSPTLSIHHLVSPNAQVPTNAKCLGFQLPALHLTSRSQEELSPTLPWKLGPHGSLPRALTHGQLRPRTDDSMSILHCIWRSHVAYRLDSCCSYLVP